MEPDYLRVHQQIDRYGTDNYTYYYI